MTACARADKPKELPAAGTPSLKIRLVVSSPVPPFLRKGKLPQFGGSVPWGIYRNKTSLTDLAYPKGLSALYRFAGYGSTSKISETASRPAGTAH